MKIHTFPELLKELKKISRELEKVEETCGYGDYGDLSGLDFSPQDPDDLFLRDELYGVMRGFADARDIVERLSRPVREQGVLRKGRNGRYRLNDVEFTCGSPIEILVDDDYHDVPYWCSGRIEHDNGDYYFTGAKNMPLKGAKARIR